MGYSSVQFIGEKTVLQAFKNMDCCNWALLQGKQFLMKYELYDFDQSLAMLTEYLKMISSSSASEATYTLRIYEYDKPKTKTTKGGKEPELPKRKIFENTPYDGSFNFKLYNQDSEPSSRGKSWQEVQELKSEFTEVKGMLTKLLAEREQDETEDKNSGIAGVLNGLMEMPEIKQAIAGKVVQLFHGVTNKIGNIIDPSNNQLPAKIAGPEPTQAIQLPQEKVDKLNTALTILVRIDPQFSDHLYKLAMIAQTNQQDYDFLITLLNNRK